MIIELSHHFDALAANEWTAYQQAIENLLAARAQGWHLLVMSRRTAEAALANLELSKTQTAVLRNYILERNATLVGQSRDAFIKIVALPEGKNLPMGGNVIPIPLREFSTLDNCQPARLIVEDADADGAFLKVAAEIFARDFSASRIFKLEIIHGGGDPIHNRYSACLESARPSICIVDGDKICPTSNFGNTALKIKSAIGKERYSSVSAIILPAREMENLIPIDFCCDIYADNPQIMSTLSTLKHLTGDQLKNGAESDRFFIRYFDMKNGLRVKEISLASGECQNYLLEIWSLIKKSEEQFDLDGDYTIVSGISQSMLKKTVQSLISSGALRRSFYETCKKYVLWEDISHISRTVFYYGACGERIALGGV